MERPPSMSAEMTFSLLNETRRVGDGRWDANSPSRLWSYNVHYFDDLNAIDSQDRTPWHVNAIANWVLRHPPASSDAWAPYPTSLRAVNWIKWALRTGKLDDAATYSLATQLRVLRQRLEYHLLANHLFVNAKALVFGGLFFEGKEAEGWLNKGMALLEREIPEQILYDGGQFERSPMYHALALEDILDLINATTAFRTGIHPKWAALIESWPAVAERMGAWLTTMCHPDHGISFFNDAALGIAPNSYALRDYATQLGVPQSRFAECDLSASGYARLQRGNWCAIFDAAPVGPDYQPAHAHADTLAFELSLGAERVITNSGTSTYEQGPQRDRERSTEAHNTVVLDNENSSEVWASFRVARRAKPFERRAEFHADRAFASCAHDGYRRLSGTPVHRRDLHVRPDTVSWTDYLEGIGRHTIKGVIPVHPNIQVEILGATAQLKTSSGQVLRLRTNGINELKLARGTYAPEFGVLVDRPVIVWEQTEQLPYKAALSLSLAR